MVLPESHAARYRVVSFSADIDQCKQLNNVVRPDERIAWVQVLGSTRRLEVLLEADAAGPLPTRDEAASVIANGIPSVSGGVFPVSANDYAAVDALVAHGFLAVDTPTPEACAVCNGTGTVPNTGRGSDGYEACPACVDTPTPPEQDAKTEAP